jgi:hypothetical protein
MVMMRAMAATPVCAAQHGALGAWGAMSLLGREGDPIWNAYDARNKQKSREVSALAVHSGSIIDKKSFQPQIRRDEHR